MAKGAGLIEDAINMLGKEAVDAIQATGKANKWTKATTNKVIRQSMRGAQPDDVVRQAKFADQFAEGAGGQMTIKGLESPAGSSTVSEAAEQASKGSDAIDGQISMFPDSTGQMHTPDSKMRQIKEARQASNRGMMESHLRDGADGQMYMDFGGMKDPSTVKSGGNDVVSEAVNKVDNTPIDGQQSFMVDKNGNLNSEYGVQQLRQAEVNKANRNWVQRRIDGVSDAWSGLKTNVHDAVTGTGDGSKLIGGRKTRETARVKANSDYIATGQGSAQSKRDFYRSNYQGKGAPQDTGPSTNPSDYSSITNPADVADQTASGGIDWSGIKDWAHDNQLIVAGGIAGGAILTASLLDE